MVNEMWWQSAGFWEPIGTLVVFGAGYAYAIRDAKRCGYLEGYTAFAVVLGTAVTVLAAVVAMVGGGVIALGQVIPVLFTLFLAFGASGLPMIVGDMAEHLEARRSEQAALREGSDA